MTTSMKKTIKIGDYTETNPLAAEAAYKMVKSIAMYITLLALAGYAQFTVITYLWWQS